ncbi:universal stress protein [Streptomyces sp. S07_1.15]|uniref:universal stress protein n=1 Tax=Streptomyces sp. S07_1.15 TaxID=2873925 RepID=UPI001D146C4B|nr:universal stress protein [Streptomyces sp. S07_1.15]MCC3655632.1 universal stress protein [Streptomyces sp. S07_1.15]
MVEQDPAPGDTGPGPVLVGVDDAHDQQIVVRHAAAEAARRGLPLHILHAVEWPLPAGAAEVYREVSAPQAQAAAVLAPFTAQAHAEHPGLNVVAEPFAGRPAAALVDRSARVSLVVVGHRGTGGFPRLPLGSVSWQVATHAECPVIVVRPGRTTVHPAHRVVVGVDTAEPTAEPLRFAFEEAALRETELTLLAAGSRPEPMTVEPVGPAVPDREAVTRAENGPGDLEDLATAWRHEYPNVPVTTRHVAGRPAAALTEASHGAELVVVGSHGRTGVRRALLGSVSAEVLHTAACPVAVVPVRAAGGG